MFLHCKNVRENAPNFSRASLMSASPARQRTTNNYKPKPCLSSVCILYIVYTKHLNGIIQRTWRHYGCQCTNQYILFILLQVPPLKAFVQIIYKLRLPLGSLPLLPRLPFPLPNLQISWSHKIKFWEVVQYLLVYVPVLDELVPTGRQIQAWCIVGVLILVQSI